MFKNDITVGSLVECIYQTKPIPQGGICIVKDIIDNKYLILEGYDKKKFDINNFKYHNVRVNK